MKTITKLILIVGCIFATGEMNAQLATFNYTGSIVSWTVPSCISSLTITVAGAQGGTEGGEQGGLGAKMQGTFAEPGGSILQILVGQQGSAAGAGSAGGGGGSFVALGSNYITATPLIVAGGGGGSFNAVNGSTGLITTSGGGYSPGTSGGGGGILPGTSGGGGGGFYTNGANGAEGNGGIAFVGGGAGSPSGGFGGGGGQTNIGDNVAGGGGGYSGGSSGGTGAPQTAAGGGGSYNIGSNQTNLAGVQSGNGIVTITWTTLVLSATGNVINYVSCHGGSNGKASGIISEGTTPLTYSWAPSGGTRDTANGLSAGTYTITVTDPCGTATASVTITQPNVLAAIATTTSNVTCHAGDNGTTSSAITGGTTPYTYLWTGGTTNSTATGLTAGSYTLNVTDINGCTATAITAITQPNALAIDSTYTTANVLCHGGSNGSAGITARGGNAPYTYAWTPSGGSANTASGLTAGAYTVTVSDACGESATTFISITQPTTMNFIVYDSTHFDTVTYCHGVAYVLGSGGVTPYSFLWSPGGQTTATITGLCNGNYCCTVTDGNGCVDSTCIRITTGIDNFQYNTEHINVYPNPNNGSFTLSLSNVIEAFNIEIYNVLGAKVYSETLPQSQNNNIINLTGQPSGVYFYRVLKEDGGLVGAGRFVVQR